MIKAEDKLKRSVIMDKIDFEKVGPLPKKRRIDAETTEPTLNEDMAAFSVKGLPYGATDKALRDAIEENSISVMDVMVKRHMFSRELMNSAIIVTHHKYAWRLLNEPVILEGQRLKITLESSVEMTQNLILHTKKDKVHSREFEWSYDVRPGHKDYKIPSMEEAERLYNLDPLDPTKSTAHNLPNEIMIKILQQMKLRDLLKVEMTCRRMQTLVRGILSGNTLINLNDQSSLWGDHRQGQLVHYHSLLIHKLLILNGPTLQHLNIGMMSFNVKDIVSAIKQCAPKLTHFLFQNFLHMPYVTGIKPLAGFMNNLVSIEKYDKLGMEEDTNKDYRVVFERKFNSYSMCECMEPRGCAMPYELPNREDESKPPPRHVYPTIQERRRKKMDLYRAEILMKRLKGLNLY